MFNRQEIETAAGPATVVRSKRRTLAISVQPNGALELMAPLDASEASIIAKVKKRLRWIVRQRVHFKEMLRDRTPLRYESGATHTYLGRQFRLKVTASEHHETSVRMRGRYLYVQSLTGKPAEVQSLLEAWLRGRAKAQFSERLEKWNAWCEARKLPVPSIRLLRMPKRWGSSHRDGRIYLNPDLVKAPAICVDYVIAHEVCHLKHPQHDRAFFRLLGDVFPNWQTIKARLERSVQN